MLPSVLRGASIEAKPSGDGHHGFACATPKACVLRKPRLGALPIRASKALGSLQLHQVAPISFLCRELAVKFPPFTGTPLPQPQPMGPTQVKVIPHWEQVKQIELFHWSILFGLVACGAIYHGLKYDNGITKGFGLTFLFINLYTRFFELFWNSLHKAIIFALLGISFWYLGTKAEKIWNLGRSSSR